MTAIDTSKLKEGMFCKFKYRGKAHQGKVEINKPGIRVMSDPWFWLTDPNGTLAQHISDVTFPDNPEVMQPDLQEQDRVEAGELKPGDEVQARFTDDWSTLKWLYHGKSKIHDGYIVEQLQDYESTKAGRVALCTDIRPIPKDPDGELREVLKEYHNDMCIIADGSTYNNFGEIAVNKIKSLLAAKGQNEAPMPTFEEFKDYMLERILDLDKTRHSDYRAAYDTFLHFTKNETK